MTEAVSGKLRARPQHQGHLQGQPRALQSPRDRLSPTQLSPTQLPVLSRRTIRTEPLLQGCCCLSLCHIALRQRREAEMTRSGS